MNIVIVVNLNMFLQETAFGGIFQSNDAFDGDVVE